MNVEIRDFVKLQKYFINKDIQLNILKSKTTESDNIFLVLDVFCPEQRKLLANQAINISQVTDYKLQTICCAVYVLMMVVKKGPDKSKLYLHICQERIGVTKNSIKKIIFRFYGIKI